MTQGRIISIVDDSAFVRTGLFDLVQSLGYTARTFASAEQFVESGSIRDTSCVITDLSMPGLSGLELNRQLRRDGHAIPLIVMTAHPGEGQCARALAEGATAFLLKPLDEDALLACLELALGR